MNQLINDKGVCRTTPATPGLLITYLYLDAFIIFGSLNKVEKIYSN